MSLQKTPKEITLPKKLRSLTDHIVKAAVNNVEMHSQILPTIILHSSEKNEAHYIALDFKDEQSKSSSFNTVKEMAREIQADTSVFITEAYLRRQEKGETVDQIYEKNGGSLENDAKAISCLLVCVETPRMNYLAQSPIQASSETKSGRTCDIPKFTAGDLDGRMVGIIQKEIIQ